MSAAKSHVTLSRQWELLNILPNRGAGKIASELHSMLNHNGFEVTKR